MKINYKIDRVKVAFNVNIILIALSAIILALTSCSSGGDEDLPVDNPHADDTSISGFSFKKSSNPGLYIDISGIQGEDIIYITLPQGMSLSSLVPSFKIAQGASVTINGQSVDSEKTSVDLSNTGELVVISESGKKAKYSILAKNGNRQLDEKVYNFMLKYNIPGISVAITKNEEIAYSAGYGFAVKESKSRVTPNTLFRLASLSKQQTALAIMTLYERGLVNMDDKVFGEGGILEDEFGTEIIPEVGQITVKHLLCHSSGWTAEAIYTGESTSLEQRIKRYITSVKPEYTPGEVYKYNNLGYCILGKVVEKVSGKDFESFLKEEVHSQAGVTDIFVGKNQSSERRNNECKYYGQSGRTPYGNDVEMSKAAGGMIASSTSLMKLMTAIDYGSKVPDILKEETLDFMYTAVPLKNTGGGNHNRYALGWMTNHTAFKHWGSYHDGNLAGVATIWVRTKNNVNAVILCNSRNYESDFDDSLWILLKDLEQMF